MKFPLSERPYAPLDLSPEQRTAYARTAMTLVRESIDEFDEYVYPQNRTMNPKLWKTVRTRENVTVYKKRELEEMVSGSVSAITKWPLPKLVGVGSVVGDFDDVMYAAISPDPRTIKIKSTYVDDELVDGEVLDSIEHGTMEDPYHFIGIKWVVKAAPSGNIVRPRDFVLIEATGIYVNDAGERYGYHAQQSVEFSQCPPLTSMGFLRAKLSSCFLLKSMANRTVETFMKSYVDPAGSVPDVVAIKSAINGLCSFWKSVYCAEKKKLARLLRHASPTTAKRQRDTNNVATPSTTDGRGRDCCGLCNHRFSLFRSAIGCELCHTIVCARCVTTRKLTSLEGQRVKKIPISICKYCLMAVGNMNAADFARREHVPDVVTSHQAPENHPLPKPWSGFGREQLPQSARSMPHANSWDGMDLLTGSDRSSVPTALSIDINIEDRPSPMIIMDERSDSLALVECRNPRSSPFVPSSVSSSPDDLWFRMQQLRVQAEQAYQLTRHNNQVMAETIGSRQPNTTHSQ